MSAPPLAIELRCPRCAAAARTNAAARSLTCGACGALLLFAWSGREAFFVQDAAVGEAQLAEALQRTHPRGQPPRLLEARRFQAPYWHISATALQAAPGRSQAGLRPLHVRSARLAHTCPAYADPLHLAGRGQPSLEDQPFLRPLEPNQVQALGPFLPWEPVSARALKPLEHAALQPLQAELRAVERLSLLVHMQRALVYRPRWLARVIGASGQGYALLDAVDGALLGRPGTLEAHALQEALTADPQAFGSDDAALQARDPSCPECGTRQRFDPYAQVQMCDACGRGLAVEASSVRQIAYAHAYWGRADPDGLWLPFWTFRLRLAPSSGEPVETLEAWTRLALPDGAPPGFEPRGALLWLPAFPLLGDAQGDALFRELAERLHEQPPQVEDGGLRPGGAAELVPASFSAAEARELGALALLCVLSGAALARMGPSALRRAHLAASLTLSRPRLTLVSFERRGDAAGLPGTTLSLPRECLRRPAGRV